MGCPPVRKIIHSLKLVDYLHVQADNPWYNYYIYFALLIMGKIYLFLEVNNCVTCSHGIAGKLINITMKKVNTTSY